MPDQPALIYLESDDEITSVVRRMRAADAARVVLVAPGRSKATSSAVALRLLERMASEEAREVAVVGDALTRSLAAEAGLSAYASVSDAVAASPAAPSAPPRAAIHVVRGDVRGDEPTVSVATPPSPRWAPPPQAPISPRDDDTRVVPVATAVPAARARPRAERAARIPMAVLAAAVAVLVVGGAAAAAILPGATIVITPATAAVGPVHYELRFEDPQIVSGTVEATQEGTATNTYTELTPATGAATFRNFNIGAVDVPAGTQVAAGEIVFVTTAAVTAPPGQLTPEGTIAGGEVTAPIAATAAGPSGNVAAEAIDTIIDTQTRNRLRGFPQNGARLVINYEATAGGLDATGPEIIQKDVDDAVAALTAALQAEVIDTLAGGEGLVAADPTEPSQPTITGAEGLVGTRDQPTFELSGELAYDRAVVRQSDVEAAAVARVAGDASVVAAGQQLVEDSIRVSIESARRDGTALVATVSVSGRSAAGIDAGSVAGRVAGMSVPDAEAELADLGAVDIGTWPGWVTAVPALTWRIEVRIEAAPTPSAAPSGSPAP